METNHCPFCGGKVIEWHAKSENPPIDLGYRFFCANNCCMQVKFYNTKEEATKAWNTRVENK